MNQYNSSYPFETYGNEDIRNAHGRKKCLTRLVFFGILDKNFRNKHFKHEITTKAFLLEIY